MNKKYLANMDYGNGDQGTWLEITKDEKQIYFCRSAVCSACGD